MATCKGYLQVCEEGKREVRRTIRHYSLPAILAVGYRVRSPRGTQFRQWAMARLSEYLVKGFTLDDERLENPAGSGTPDSLDELLERIRDIRDIRASQKRGYLRVREILALAADYEPAAVRILARRCDAPSRALSDLGRQRRAGCVHCIAQRREGGSGALPSI